MLDPDDIVAHYTHAQAPTDNQVSDELQHDIVIKSVSRNPYIDPADNVISSDSIKAHNNNTYNSAFSIAPFLDI